MSQQAVPPAGGAPRGGVGGAGGGRDAYDTIGDPHRQEVSSVKRRLYILVVLAAALAAACALTWSITWQRGVAELQRNAAVRVNRTTSALKSTLDRYESLPYLLGSHPYVQDLLAEPQRADLTARANRYLEDLNEHAHATVTYVVGADGLCVAASNWRAPDSFVGIEYRFRPYFIDAMNGRVGRFFGIGTISRDPGYYISQPVWRDGRIAGVVVVKLNLEWFQGADASEPLVVADDHGVVFLSSVPAWKYHTLHPLTEPVAASIYETRQYAQQPVTPLPLRVEQVLGADAEIVRVGAGRRAPRFLASKRRIGEPDWLLVTLAPLAPVDADARNATIVTGFGFVSIALLAFYWRMRRARVREMIRGRALLQQAYAELNRRVEERTADLSQANAQLQKEVGDRIRAEQELRAAHDELIQASKLAALGQMAAGITHELNQPLAALRSFSDNTRVLLDRGEQGAARENLEAIAALTERMGKITNQLKLFVGRAKPRNERALVVRALRSVLALLGERMRGVALTLTLRDATVAPAQDAPLDLAGDYPELVARCEDLRLEQVLINLLGNALDAVGGAAAAAVVAAPAIDVTIVVSAATLSIEVRDNGPGIAPDLLPRLFEPFFTTKEMGRGLGLGLAISSSIASDAGGALTARNAPDGGALFVLTLRRARTHHPDAASEPIGSR
ncbi:sensor histidine kinase [Burkholderia vietnamiensis]|uniref:sensor histidine kinase n=1 Tax=Burkholderia vietnamiensis TaxID=60552 RepID=UPI0015936479|nr:ATP-binding protein [Burkholderia vietnamiensis]MCA7943544.1 two-component sensor histidine kinase [Burkholderia vietnamiensis]MEC4599859.1 ATP-binding protein [Burkholderia vietnamiensis]HDR8974643.1 sensor histidine kinase [Burkholderia vietnamiensis]HDR9147289.1 sensor histidine kinase [Burkholderia vietnamiensis]HDR9219961.1 sensor histidine kinase [Burkholderia vietnamiensis]